MAKKKRDGVFLRGSVYWCRDPLQQGKRVSTGTQDKEQALAWLNKQKQLAQSPTYQTAAKASLGYWFEATLTAKSKDKSEATLGYYTQKLGHFRRLWGDSCPLIAIVPAKCDQYVESRRNEGATDHTICKEFSCLIQLLKHARRAGAYPHQIESLKPLDLAPHYVPRKRALTIAEVNL